MVECAQYCVIASCDCVCFMTVVVTVWGSLGMFVIHSSGHVLSYYFYAVSYVLPCACSCPFFYAPRVPSHVLYSTCMHPFVPSSVPSSTCMPHIVLLPVPYYIPLLYPLLFLLLNACPILYSFLSLILCPLFYPLLSLSAYTWWNCLVPKILAYTWWNCQVPTISAYTWWNCQATKVACKSPLS